MSTKQKVTVIGLALALGVMALATTIHFKGRPVPPTEGGTLIFSDDFERDKPGPEYRRAAADYGYKAGTWVIEDGRLKAEKIHNAALWLQVPLPEKVRIEFDARAHSNEGDVKCEVFGDGKTHQSGYILIHGGWKNSSVCIARQDEHGEDRKVDNRDCSVRNGRRHCVESGLDYRWAVQRTDGTLKWYLNGRLVMTYPDNSPIQGRYFGFNNWEAPVTFDNLRIYDLGKVN